MSSSILVGDSDPDRQELQKIKIWDTHFANRIFLCLKPFGWELFVTNHEVSLVKPDNEQWIIECYKNGSNIFQKGFSNPLYVICFMGHPFLTIETEVRGSSTIYRYNNIVD
jgi:hypothetical protein